MSTKLWRQSFLRKQSQQQQQYSSIGKNYSTLSNKLRLTMRSIAQPVSVVSVHLPSSSNRIEKSIEDNHAATLSSLSSVSLNPPIIAFSVRTPSRLATFLTSRPPPTSSSSSSTTTPSEPIKITVNLLSASQREVAQIFSRQKLEKYEFWNPGKISELWKAEQEQDQRRSLLSEQEQIVGDEKLGSTERRGGSGFPKLAFQSLKEMSLARMDCEIVSYQSLRSFDESSIDANTASEVGGDEAKGSILFLARVKEITEGELGKRGYGALVYYDGNYDSVSDKR